MKGKHDMLIRLHWIYYNAWSPAEIERQGSLKAGNLYTDAYVTKYLAITAETKQNRRNENRTRTVE